VVNAGKQNFGSEDDDYSSDHQPHHGKKVKGGYNRGEMGYIEQKVTSHSEKGKGKKMWFREKDSTH